MPTENPFCVENCPLEFQCNKRWSDLKRIDNEPDIRFCSDCQKPVYKLDRYSDYESHAAAGHCVALDFKSTMLIGETAPDYETVIEIVDIAVSDDNANTKK